MTRIRGEVTIDAPVGAVFDTVADERNEPRYNPRIVRAEKLDGAPIGSGTRFVAEPRGTRTRGRMTLEIVDYDRPYRLHNRIDSAYMRVDGTLSFTRSDGKTRLRWDWDMRLVGWMRLLSPVLGLVGPRWERRNWVGLKQYLEGQRA